ncbi:MAG: oligosaccharide flippase family protein [Candidatus Pacebacteria bacterium]|nr:oligosaccharide flippase family protein [Candidatus Paceibacterota bacterium]
MKKFNWIIKKFDTFFQLNTKKILGQASYLLGGHVVSNLLSFAVAVAAAHFISKDTYGTYRYILSIVSFVGAFSLTGLSTAIIRDVARGYDNIFKTSFIRSLIWSTPAFILGLGTGAWYLLNNNMVLGLSITLGSILFPVIQALLLYRSYLNGKKYYRALMKSNIAYSTVTSLAILATLFFNPTVTTLVVVYYVSNIVILFILKIVIQNKFKPNEEKDPENGKLEHHMSLMNMLDIGATQLDKIILFQIAGPIEVARYTFATMLPEQLRNIIKYIPTLSMPIFSDLPKETAKTKGLFLVKKLFLITIPIVVLYILVAPFAYKILFPAYTEVILYSQVFSLILIFDGGISGAILKAQNQIKNLYWVNATSNIARIILLLVFGYMWGIWGVIVSRIAGRIISFLIAYILVLRMKTS